jgi:multidrug efflux system outer membrane protein
VLLRRPDIAEAEYNARSEHALVKRAYSQFYPSLILSATGGFQSPTLQDFLNVISRYWSDSVQVNQLIFDGGRTYYNLQLEVDRFQQASASYQQQVLIAFREVEDALANLDSYSKQYDVAISTSQWAQKTYQLYSDRYKLGVTYYIDVANTERDWLNYQVSVNTLLGYRYLATIQLIQALGGGWYTDDKSSIYSCR